jgi:hypothetical protein
MYCLATASEAPVIAQNVSAIMNERMYVIWLSSIDKQTTPSSNMLYSIKSMHAQNS